MDKEIVASLALPDISSTLPVVAHIAQLVSKVKPLLHVPRAQTQFVSPPSLSVIVAMF